MQTPIGARLALGMGHILGSDLAAGKCPEVAEEAQARAAVYEKNVRRLGVAAEQHARGGEDGTHVVDLRRATRGTRQASSRGLGKQWFSFARPCPCSWRQVSSAELRPADWGLQTPCPLLRANAPWRTACGCNR